MKLNRVELQYSLPSIAAPKFAVTTKPLYVSVHYDVTSTPTLSIVASPVVTSAPTIVTQPVVNMTPTFTATPSSDLATHVQVDPTPKSANPTVTLKYDLAQTKDPTRPPGKAYRIPADREALLEKLKSRYRDRVQTARESRLLGESAAREELQRLKSMRGQGDARERVLLREKLFEMKSTEGSRRSAAEVRRALQALLRAQKALGNGKTKARQKELESARRTLEEVERQLEKAQTEHR